MQVLSEHEHVIDCIAWAGLEAAKTIEDANYNGGSNNVENNNDGMLNDENGIEESKMEESKESGEP